MHPVKLKATHTWEAPHQIGVCETHCWRRTQTRQTSGTPAHPRHEGPPRSPTHPRPGGEALRWAGGPVLPCERSSGRVLASVWNPDGSPTPPPDRATHLSRVACDRLPATQLSADPDGEGRVRLEGGSRLLLSHSFHKCSRCGDKAVTKDSRPHRVSTAERPRGRSRTPGTGRPQCARGPGQGRASPALPPADRTAACAEP